MTRATCVCVENNRAIEYLIKVFEKYLKYLKNVCVPLATQKRNRNLLGRRK